MNTRDGGDMFVLPYEETIHASPRTCSQSVLVMATLEVANRVELVRHWWEVMSPHASNRSLLTSMASLKRLFAR